MSKNEEAAPAVAAAESGEGKSLEAASVPVCDCNTERRQRQAERAFCTLMKTVINDGTGFIPFSVLSVITLIQEKELAAIFEGGARVYVLREVPADGRRKQE